MKNANDNWFKKKNGNNWGIISIGIINSLFTK